MTSVFREADRGTHDSDGCSDIAYPAIADELFHAEGQRLVPFLGAGASLPSPTTQSQSCDPNAKSLSAVEGAVERVCQELALEGPAKLILQVSTCIAVRLQQRLRDSAAQTQQDPIRQLKESQYPPSAADLAEAFCHRARYDALAAATRKTSSLSIQPPDRERLRQALRALLIDTGLGSASAPLLSAASYFEYVDNRASLWELLKGVFETKKTPTKTHDLVARAAKFFLDHEASQDYLIVSTNYDRLMELALDTADVPYYVVVTVPRANSEGRVAIRLSDSVRTVLGERAFERFRKTLNASQDRSPRDFIVQPPKPLVCLYKIHGCLFPAEPDQDSIVITDEDYIRYIYHDGKYGMLPANVRNLLLDKALLFLGYSFSDWNIRSHYELVAEYRTSSRSLPTKDYAVMLELHDYDKGFFSKRDVHILETALDKFCDGVTNAFDESQRM